MTTNDRQKRTVLLEVTCPECDEPLEVEVEVDLPDTQRPPAPRTPSLPRRLYRLVELESILGLKRRSIRQLIQDGKLKAQKSSHDQRAPWLVAEADVQDYLQRRGPKSPELLSVSSRGPVTPDPND
jgi:hypothetical protein